MQQSPFTEMPFKHWCEGGDLNRYALRRGPRSYHLEKTSADTPYLESSSRCPPVRIPQAPLSDGIPVDTRHGLLLRLMCPSQTRFRSSNGTIVSRFRAMHSSNLPGIGGSVTCRSPQTRKCPGSRRTAFPDTGSPVCTGSSPKAEALRMLRIR